MDFDFGTLFFGIVFGLIGFVAWRHGRQNQSGRHMILAIILMVFSYFMPNVWVTLLVGGFLTVLLFWP